METPDPAVVNPDIKTFGDNLKPLLDLIQKSLQEILPDAEILACLVVKHKTEVGEDTVHEALEVASNATPRTTARMLAKSSVRVLSALMDDAFLGEDDDVKP